MRKRKKKINNFHYKPNITYKEQLKNKNIHDYFEDEPEDESDK